jgi:uncharacterized membrane protein
MIIMQMAAHLRATHIQLATQVAILAAVNHAFQRLHATGDTIHQLMHVAVVAIQDAITASLIQFHLELTSYGGEFAKVVWI